MKVLNGFISNRFIKEIDVHKEVEKLIKKYEDIIRENQLTKSDFSVDIINNNGKSVPEKSYCHSTDNLNNMISTTTYREEYTSEFEVYIDKGDFNSPSHIFSCMR